ncbi:MAG: twin-arginine translocase subunit TatC [Deltaproteobacteria bacterium]|nr:twin-arginine translocase subunit TatC [Deltaproteobacteria bacterium]
MSDDAVMSFSQHLEELRKRLKYSAIWLVIWAGVGYALSDFLFVILAQPLIRAWTDAGLGPPKMHFSNPIEPFFTYMKLALIFGVFAASPFIFYQLWKFIAPGLYRKEKRYAVPFAAASGLLFIGGACFGYFVLFPYAFRFFLGFARKNVGRMEELLGGTLKVSMKHTFELTPTLMMGEYFSLTWKLLLASGVVFELPLVIAFLSLAGLVSARALWRFNRYFIVIAFVIGAVLTPGPDVISQVLLSVPLVVLYNLSILFALVTERRRARRTEDAAGGSAESEPGQAH